MRVLHAGANSWGRFQRNLKYHLYEVQTEIVERLALEDGAGVFRLIREHKVVFSPSFFLCLERRAPERAPFEGSDPRVNRVTAQAS